MSIIQAIIPGLEPKEPQSSFENKKAANCKQISELPPMLQDYLGYKRAYPDSVIFYQVGDFFEVFFDDAVKIAQELNLTLTSRDKNQAAAVPMCGVPIASVEPYLQRLVALGYSIGLVSQTNASSTTRLPTLFKQELRGNKVSIRRELSRLITPGINFFTSPVEPSSGSVLAALYWLSETDMALAFSDLHSGIVWLKEGLDISSLILEVERLTPSELLLPDSLENKAVNRRYSWVRRLERCLPPKALKFRTLRAEAQNLNNDQKRQVSAIPGYAALSEVSKKAFRLLISYLDETTLNATLSVSEIRLGTEENVLQIDASTRAHLELLKNSKDGSTQNTLFSLLNHCCTAAGTRLLRSWIAQPLAHVGKIHERQDALSYLIEQSEQSLNAGNLLKGMPDLERLAARLELMLASPRELLALRDCLAKIPNIKALFRPSGPSLLNRLSEEMQCPEEHLQLLEASIADDASNSLSDGGVIKTGYNKKLDEFRAIKQDNNSWLKDFEAKERERSGISSLKVKFNFVLGYFIEVTRSNLTRVPQDYIRRQSSANNERFSTEALRARESQILNAAEQAASLEKELYEGVCQKLKQVTQAFRLLSTLIAQLDVLLSLAEVAKRERFVRPLVENSSTLNVKGGKHPVLLALLRGDFIANDIQLDEEHSFALITGPNMGGKSTYLRQTGLLVVMAQMGSFIPAVEARIGICDRIFARLGASDNIFEGDSTFMLEMREAAYIIQGASERSLLLIDEIGRGTATADGLAIARAILEWIVVKIGCRTLFATHFHELTSLPAIYPSIFNLSVASTEHDGEVIFTHEITKGSASKSYAIEVAKLAGLPLSLLQRAKSLLEECSTGSRVEVEESSSGRAEFASDRNSDLEIELMRGLYERVKKLKLDDLSPRQAQSILYELQTILLNA